MQSIGKLKSEHDAQELEASRLRETVGREQATVTSLRVEVESLRYALTASEVELMAAKVAIAPLPSTNASPPDGATTATVNAEAEREIAALKAQLASVVDEALSQDVRAVSEAVSTQAQHAETAAYWSHAAERDREDLRRAEETVLRQKGEIAALKVELRKSLMGA